MKKLIVALTLIYVVTVISLCATLQQRGRIVEVQTRIIELDKQIIAEQRKSLDDLEGLTLKLFEVIVPRTGTQFKIKPDIF